jgi:hypothetical protein
VVTPLLFIIGYSVLDVEDPAAVTDWIFAFSFLSIVSFY